MNFSFAQETKIVKSDTLKTVNTNQPNSTQAEEGDVKITDGTNTLIRITDEGTYGAIEIKDGVPTTTTDKLYNDGGTLKFNNTTLGGSGATELKDLTDAQYDGSSLYLGNGAGGTSDDGFNNNTAVGKDALFSNTTGYYNTANGAGALNSNTTGNSNTANGYQSLRSNTTGYYNTANGRLALRSNTTGFSNTANGYQSLDYNTTGYANTANGAGALNRNTTGKFNVGLGNNVNSFNQEGSNNTTIGFEAGKGTSLHNKSGNIFLGYQAGYSETSDNKLYIENSNSTSPLIWGDFATDKLAVNGKLGIGTQNPLYDLQLYSDAGPQVLFQNIDTGINGFRIGINSLEQAYFIQEQNQDMFFFTNNTEKVRIKASGEFGIGTDNPTDKVHIVSASGQDALRVQVGSSTKLRVFSNGGVAIGLNSSSTPANGLYVHGDLNYNAALTSVSDKRFKTNIEPIENAVERIKSIRGVYYDWNRAKFPKRDFTDKHQIGVLAQEVEKEFPELVSTGDDGYKSVDYTKLAPILIEAVKEQQERFKYQDERIKTLEEENKNLRTVINNNKILVNKVELLEQVLNKLVKEQPQIKFSNN